MPRADKAAFIQNMLSELQQQQNGSAPVHHASDSKEWWREVAQGLGVEVNRERARAEAAEQQRDEALAGLRVADCLVATRDSQLAALCGCRHDDDCEYGQ